MSQSTKATNQSSKQRIRPLGSTKEHYWLALRMAKAVGVDLVEATERGDFDQVAWSQAVQSCRSCDDVAGCRRWLSQDDADTEVPASCENKALFASLKALQEDT